MTAPLATRRPKRNSKAGVTLLEIMIVLAIMALVIGVGAPRFLDSFGRAKSQTAGMQLANLKGALQMFYIDNGRHPSEAEGLDALVRQPAGLTRWRGPYLDGEEGLLADGSFDLMTYGRDGRAGGTSEDSDITS
jgi:general secretion pathway protein G